MWCLLRLLPLMIGYMVPENDKKWEVLLQLREIVEYIFSPSLTESSTYVLDWLVEMHHENFLAVRHDFVIIQIAFTETINRHQTMASGASSPRT